MIQSIRNAVEQMNALELKHSKMERMPNGDMKFIIAPFPREAANVRDELREAVRSHLAGFDDARAELLGEALLQCKILRTTGAEADSPMCRQVAGADGHMDWKPLALVDRGRPIIWKLEPVDRRVEQQRIDRLMAKHLPKP